MKLLIISSAILPLVAFNLLAEKTFAQVTVGYNTNLSVVGSSISENIYRQRVVDHYAVSGVNVEPKNGSNNFHRDTVWKIYDEDKDWSLTVVDSNPRVDVNKEDVSTRLVQAGRRESVYSTISGPLRSTVKRKTLNPFSSVQLPLIVPVSTSVFPEELGIDKNSSRFSRSVPSLFKK